MGAAIPVTNVFPAAMIRVGYELELSDFRESHVQEF